jgi:hypothetical protein
MATSRAVTTLTGSDGAYNARSLESGRYAVKFELAGFAPAEYPDVNLLVGQTITVNMKMKVGGVQTSVQVTDLSPQVDFENVAIAHHVTAEEFDQLPKGRSFQGLRSRPVGRESSKLVSGPSCARLQQRLQYAKPLDVSSVEKSGIVEQLQDWFGALGVPSSGTSSQSFQANPTISV